MKTFDETSWKHRNHWFNRYAPAPIWHFIWFGYFIYITVRVLFGELFRKDEKDGQTV